MSNNHLRKDKQIAVTAALAEGNSIRSIERMTGIHRDTIMRLGVRVGQGCAELLDQKMRNLDCNRIELDEIWGFIGKKVRHLREDDDRPMATFGPTARSMLRLSLCPRTRLPASAICPTQLSSSVTLNRA
jgi:hypothetical protein